MLQLLAHTLFYIVLGEGIQERKCFFVDQRTNDNFCCSFDRIHTPFSLLLIGNNSVDELAESFGSDLD
jgi:hypothetical protein